MSAPRRALVMLPAQARAAVRKALAGAGWEVDDVASPADLQARLAAGRYDAVVADAATATAAPAGATAEETERLRCAVVYAREVAHDLAQPLTTILARAQLLRGRLKPDDPNHHPVSVICKEADRLADLVTRFQKLREMSAAPEPRQATAPRRDG